MSKYADDTLVRVGRTWFLKSHDRFIDFTIYKPVLFQVLLKANYYSPEEVKARGMRWVTIRGARVLLQGVGDSWVVVGGAGGKLNHMKIDRILSKEDYSEKRKEKEKQKRDAGRELTPEEKAAEQKKSEERRQQEAAALTDYAKKVTELTGGSVQITPENIKKVESAANKEIAFNRKVMRAMLTPEEVEKIREAAKDHVKKQKRYRDIGEKRDLKSEKDMQTHIDKEIDRRVKRNVKEKIHDIERKATQRIAHDMLDVGVTGGTDSAMDLDKAKEVLKFKRDFKNKMKEIYGETEEDNKAYRVGMTYAGDMESDFDSILDEVKRDIETEKNIEFYDKIDAKYDQVNKHIDKAASSALNGIMADAYGTGAYFNSSMVKELGIDAVARAIAYKIQTDGRSDVVREALVRHSNRVRLKTVSEALENADDAVDNTKGIMDLADGDDNAYSKATANGYAIRHRTQALQELAGAAGSLRAMAHMIDALEDPPNDLLQIDMGRDLAKAHRRAKRAGLKSDQYSIKRQSNGRLMAEIKSSSLTPFFDNSHETNIMKQKLNAIKRHELNTGKVSDGIKPEYGWSKDAPDAQEAGYRFATERGRSLLDFKAGLGKTFVTANLVADAVKQGKKTLIAVPANLKEQQLAELRKFTNPDIGDQIKSSFDYTSRGGVKELGQDERRARYNEGGVHIISHNALINDKESLMNAGFENIIVDEVHQIINSKLGDNDKKVNSATYRSLKELSQNANSFTAMTGTPIKTHKVELKKIADIVDPNNNLGSNTEFVKRHEGINQATSAFQSSETEALRKEVSGLTYSQGYELKPKLVSKDVKVSVSPEQKRRIKQIQEEYALENLKGNKNAAAKRDIDLWRNTHLTGGIDNPKFQSIVQDIQNNQQNKKGLLFFSQGAATEGVKAYTKNLNKVFGEGTAEGVSSKTSATQLKRLKERINDPNDPLRFLVGTETLATGHNLQGATFIHHVDIPQSKAQSDQQDARSYRKGQESDVDTVHFHSNDPNDINKRFNFKRKTKESQLVGNESSVAGIDDGGFGAMLHQVSKEMGVGA
jgi:hypothetical protein